MRDINGFERSEGQLEKRNKQEGIHEDLRGESKPCFELPAKIKENSCERPYLTDEYPVMVIDQ